MNKREHFECWLKVVRPQLTMTYDADGDYYLNYTVDLAYLAWLASPKTRPTEPNKISKEQLAAMKADTTEIVNHLRGIYTGIADAYPVNPLMLKAANEIERLRGAIQDLCDAANDLMSVVTIPEHSCEAEMDILRVTLNKHQTATKEQ